MTELLVKAILALDLVVGAVLRPVARSTARAKLAAARARLAGIQWAPAPAPTPI